ncbi:ATP-binding protein [Krasilnikovia sp. MM14-A1259]|uniref:ATP-binding protein n=1 Tax=Krasilnikovia sp. MM14-A1259 TaxID=3373539 RepID=UPI00399CEDB5
MTAQSADLTVGTEPDLARGLIVLCPSGRWTARSQTLFVQALNHAFNEQPRAVVVDLAHLDIAAEIDVATLVELHAGAGRRPGLLLLWAHPSPALALRLGWLVQTRSLYWSVEEAVAHALRNPGGMVTPPWVCERYAATPDATAASRRLVARACHQWDVLDAIDDAQLVVSELTANAVEHGRGDVIVSVDLRDGNLTIAVRDENPAPPAPREADPDRHPLRDRGRGLVIIERVSTGWGSLPRHPLGKTVWATLAGRGTGSPGA